MTATEFAWEVIEMQRRIDFLEAELEHYKYLHALHCDTQNRSLQSAHETVGLTLKALLGATENEL